MGASWFALHFSRMPSKGSRFTRGWGLSYLCRRLRLCSQLSATVCSRRQPFATVCSCLQVSARGRYGRAYGKFCKKSIAFRAFQRRIAIFRVAGVALCDISTCFMTCQTSFCVAGVILLASLSEDDLCFSSFLRIAFSALREVVTRCEFRGRCGILSHVMKIDGILAQNVDYEVGP